MNSIKRFLSFLFHYVFGAYKDSHVEEVPELNGDITTLYVKSMSGVEIRFYCKKKNFIIRNEHPYVPDFHFSVYMISGNCNSNNACPQKLQEALQKVAHFPTLRPYFITEENRRKFLIETYISLLNNELMNKK